MNLNSDFRDLLFELNAADANYLVVGAVAVVFHSEPRFSNDSDVWVEPSPDNAARVFPALARFGAPMGEMTQADFGRPGITFQIGLPPNRIDVLTEIDGVEFGAAWANRVEARYGDQRMWVISIDDLIRNKRAVDRPKDRLDLEKLEKALRLRKT